MNITDIVKFTMLSVMMCIVCGLIYWVANDMSFGLSQKKNEWPLSYSNLSDELYPLGYLYDYWELKDVTPDEGELIVNFWYFPPFEDEVLVSFRVSSNVHGVFPFLFGFLLSIHWIV